MYKHAYLWFALALLVVLAGFFPTFLTRLDETDLAHHMHGISALSWMVLLIWQAWIYSRGRIDLHRITGKIAFVLLPIVILSSANMTHIFLNRSDTAIVQSIVMINMFALVMLAAFFILAIKHRHETPLHGRYMAATVFLLLPPGLSRVFSFYVLYPFDPPAGLNVILSLVLIEGVLAYLIYREYRDGKIYPPFVITLALFAVQHAAFPYMGEWALWRSLTAWFAGI